MFVLSLILLLLVCSSVFTEQSTALEVFPPVNLFIRGFMVWALCFSTNQSGAVCDIVEPVVHKPQATPPRYFDAEIDDCMRAVYGGSKTLKNMTASRRAKLRFSVHKESSSSLAGVCGKWNMGVPVPSTAQFEVDTALHGVAEPRI
jgi:hypothetical protein